MRMSKVPLWLSLLLFFFLILYFFFVIVPADKKAPAAAAAATASATTVVVRKASLSDYALTVSVQAKMNSPIKAITSPSHKIVPTVDDKNGLVLSFDLLFLILFFTLLFVYVSLFYSPVYEALINI